MADYRATADAQFFIRTSDGASVPRGQITGSSLLLEAWLLTGTPDPYVAPQLPPVPPATCSPLQGRKALRAAGLIDQVNAAVKASTPDTQDAWEFASILIRTDPLIKTLGAQLQLSDAALDNLFTLAATYV